MTSIHEITAAAGAHKRRKRVGRGESSGRGKTCGRGNKGCQSRSGGGTRRLTEGGQMPMFRRLPKRGFSNFNFRTEYVVVNLGTLNDRFADGESVDLNSLRERRLLQGPDPLVKVLAKGTLERKLSVAAHAFSGKARELIEKAGGTVKLLEVKNRAALAKAKRGGAAKGGGRPDRKAKSPRLLKKLKSAEKKSD